MRNYYNGMWNMSDKCLITTVCFLAGLVLGFMMSPIKRGICCDNSYGYIPPVTKKN